MTTAGQPRPTASQTTADQPRPADFSQAEATVE
jgi:hypothetical protein